MSRSIPVTQRTSTSKSLFSCALLLLGGCGGGSDPDPTPPDETLPSIELTSPTGGEEFLAGESITVSWSTQGDVGNVSIELSSSDNTWALAVDTANDGSEEVILPDMGCGDCWIRVTEVAPRGTFGASGPFVIQKLSLSSPSGGESFIGGESITVQWDAEGSIDSVDVELSVDCGSNWSKAASAVDGAGGSAAVTLPQVESSCAFVKVADVDGTPSVQSPSFTINPTDTSSITITSPNGGETWYVGETATVTWEATGSFASMLTVELSADGGTTWTGWTSAWATDGSVSQVVPNTASDMAMVRVADPNGAASDTSDGAFTIAGRPTIEVLAPKGYETFPAGSTQQILWQSFGSVGDVRIDFSTDRSGWTELVASTPNDGRQDVVMPATTTTTGYIRVAELDGDPAAISDGPFVISPAGTPTITVAQPDTWSIGENAIVRWSSAGAVGNVRIEVSTDGGSTWAVLVEEASNDGLQVVPVPYTPSTNCLLRVSALDDAASDTSDDPFEIAYLAPITITSPLPGDRWVAGKTQAVTWVSNSTAAHVNIFKSTDGGATWSTLGPLSENTANDGLFELASGFGSCSRCRVRITTLGYPSYTAESRGDFESAGLEVLGPTEGDTWVGASQQTVIWTPLTGFTPTVDNVDIELTTLPGGTRTLLVGNTPNDGFEAITVPNDVVSSTCQIRVKEAGGDLYDWSSGYFTITATANTISVVSPNSPLMTQYAAEGPLTVLWSTTGTVGDVRIELSLDDGATWITLAASTPNDGSEVVTLPFAYSNTCRIRVAEADGSPSDVSDARFTIMPVPYKIVDLTTGDVTNADSFILSPTVRTTELVLRLIEPGSFWMGDEVGTGDADERPKHLVNITRPFYIGIYEVTQQQWLNVEGTSPSSSTADFSPVESITWMEAGNFASSLNDLTGLIFRLPTEAQWEYACKAGTSTRYSWGDDLAAGTSYAWTALNSAGSHHTVGSQQANPWGLYDMHGNVREWVSDPYSSTWYQQCVDDGIVDDPAGPSVGDGRVARGGDFASTDANPPTSSQRAVHPYDTSSPKLGMRVVLTVP